MRRATNENRTRTTNDREDYKKFTVGKDPLEKEEKIDVLQPQNYDEEKRMIKLLKRLMKDSKSKAEANAFQVYLCNIQGKSLNGIIRKEFARDFVTWYRGTGKEEDHKKTWWYRQSLLMDPEIRAYDEAFLNKRHEYLLKLHVMANRAPVGIKEAYLYFKYIVRGEELDNINFLNDRQLFQEEFFEARKVQWAWEDGKRHEMAPWGNDQRTAIALKQKQEEERRPVPVPRDDSPETGRKGPGGKKLGLIGKPRGGGGGGGDDDDDDGGDGQLPVPPTVQQPAPNQQAPQQPPPPPAQQGPPSVGPLGGNGYPPGQGPQQQQQQEADVDNGPPTASEEERVRLREDMDFIRDNLAAIRQAAEARQDQQPQVIMVPDQAAAAAVKDLQTQLQRTEKVIESLQDRILKGEKDFERISGKYADITRQQQERIMTLQTELQEARNQANEEKIKQLDAQIAEIQRQQQEEIAKTREAQNEKQDSEEISGQKELLEKEIAMLESFRRIQQMLVEENERREETLKQSFQDALQGSITEFGNVLNSRVEELTERLITGHIKNIGEFRQELQTLRGQISEVERQSSEREQEISLDDRQTMSLLKKQIKATDQLTERIEQNKGDFEQGLQEYVTMGKNKFAQEQSLWRNRFASVDTEAEQARERIAASRNREIERHSVQDEVERRERLAAERSRQKQEKAQAAERNRAIEAEKRAKQLEQLENERRLQREKFERENQEAARQEDAGKQKEEEEVSNSNVPEAVPMEAMEEEKQQEPQEPEKQKEGRFTFMPVPLQHALQNAERTTEMINQQTTTFRQTSTKDLYLLSSVTATEFVKPIVQALEQGTQNMIEVELPMSRREQERKTRALEVERSQERGWFSSLWSGFGAYSSGAEQRQKEAQEAEAFANRKQQQLEEAIKQTSLLDEERERILGQTSKAVREEVKAAREVIRTEFQIRTMADMAESSRRAEEERATALAEEKRKENEERIRVIEENKAKGILLQQEREREKKEKEEAAKEKEKQDAESQQEIEEDRKKILETEAAEEIAAEQDRAEADKPKEQQPMEVEQEEVPVEEEQEEEEKPEKKKKPAQKKKKSSKKPAAEGEQQGKRRKATRTAAELLEADQAVSSVKAQKRNATKVKSYRETGRQSQKGSTSAKHMTKVKAAPVGGGGIAHTVKPIEGYQKEVDVPSNVETRGQVERDLGELKEKLTTLEPKSDNKREREKEEQAPEEQNSAPVDPEQATALLDKLEEKVESEPQAVAKKAVEIARELKVDVDLQPQQNEQPEEYKERVVEVISELRETQGLGKKMSKTDDGDEEQEDEEEEMEEEGEDLTPQGRFEVEGEEKKKTKKKKSHFQGRFGNWN